MEPTLPMAEALDPELRDVCTANFEADAKAKGIPSDFRPLTIRLAHEGSLAGGLVGRTLRGWLYVDNLALPQGLLGQGLGRRLLLMAEAEAARRGCVGSFLNTDAFQAPGFYERLGYSEFGRLVHDDPAQTRIWFSKRFTSASAAPSPAPG